MFSDLLYVQYVNRTYQRSGTLWEGSFRSCLAHDETYMFSCKCYIELNRVQAGMVARPADYRWSNYRSKAQGAPETLVQHHVFYEALGFDADQRQSAYRELFRYQLDPGVVDAIRQATNVNYALGDTRSTAHITEMLGPSYPAYPARRGKGQSPVLLPPTNTLLEKLKRSQDNPADRNDKPKHPFPLRCDEAANSANDSGETGLDIKPGTNEYDRTVEVAFARGNVNTTIPYGEPTSDAGDNAHSKAPNAVLCGNLRALASKFSVAAPC